MVWVSLVLAIAIIIVIVGGFLNRRQQGLGIGWQFIRFNVIAISLPVTCILALNGQLTGEAATIIGGALGYCFGKNDGRKPSNRSSGKTSNSKSSNAKTGSDT